MTKNIGYTLKNIRKKEKITLKSLSEKTGFSVAFLSNVERNITSPTIANLHTICYVLNVNLLDVLTTPQEKLCVKLKEREEILSNKEERISFFSMVATNRHLKCYCMEVTDEDEHSPTQHINDEIGIIVSGELKITINSSEYLLKEGDTIYVPAKTKHFFQKIGLKKSISYWITLNKEI